MKFAMPFDPVRMIESHRQSRSKLKLLYFDCRARDEFNIIWGARIMHSKLNSMQIEHHYEEFEGGHRRIGHRYDVSLPLIPQKMSG